ncbi:MAG: menaquinone biosynthesis protein [Bacteroidales bacterium]|nr:menaquinone biosynthesis protein [Bacteroidales bacterium]
MSIVKISVVSYLNSIPFIYGIKNSGYIDGDYSLELDIPSVCAKKLITGDVDIGLIPVAVIPNLKYSEIISDYCIGAVSKVRSVLLISNVPINKINTIYLDYQSRTSVMLVRILAYKFWNIKVKWENSNDKFDYNNFADDSGALIIGDKTFELANKFNYVYDLAEQWIKYTQLPFVFACWISNKKINSDFINNFNLSLDYGINNLDKVIDDYLCSENKLNVNIKEYLTKNISYKLDNKKREGMKLFHKLSAETCY